MSALLGTRLSLVGAHADLERDQPRRTQESAEDDLFALGESALNVRPVARVAQRLGDLRLSVSNDDAHKLLSNRRLRRNWL